MQNEFIFTILATRKIRNTVRVAIAYAERRENQRLHIQPKKTRHGTAYIACTESGAEVMHFWRKDRAEAWLRNEIYA